MKTSRIDRVLLAATAIASAPACTSPGPTADEVQRSQAQGLTTTSAPVAEGVGGPIVADPGLPDMIAVPSTAQLALGDPTEAATLRKMARQAASMAGVLSPGAISVVAAHDHQAAEFILSGTIVNDHAPVYVIKVRGGPFTALSAPPGQAHPQGDFLTITVDATTHRVTDIGFAPVEPDLRKIGSAVVDL